MRVPYRNVAVLSLLSIVALGAVALAGLWHPAGMSAGAQEFLPKVTLPTVIAAGAVDGINPCAFTVLLLFIACAWSGWAASTSPRSS